MTRTRGRIVCVSEGVGDQEAVPRLVVRWLKHHGVGARFDVARLAVMAKTGDRLTHAHDAGRRLGIEHYVSVALRQQPTAVLVVLDADDACLASAARRPGPLGPALLDRARGVAGDVHVSVVIAHREFEAWFLADFPSLRERRIVRSDARLPDGLWHNPESRRGCKEVLAEVLSGGYRPARDQLRVTDALSMGSRMRDQSRSYRKFHEEMGRIARLGGAV